MTDTIGSGLAQEPAAPRWFQNAAVVTVSLLCCWPVGLSLVWSNKQWTHRAKLIITGIFVGIIMVGSIVSAVATRNESSQTPRSMSTSTIESGPTTTIATPPPLSVETTVVLTPSSTSTSITASRGKVMPDVIGMNLQQAQDLIQSSGGVFFSSSYDCTGAGRRQLFDSNWIVVRQTPAPGSSIDGVTPNLGVVKSGEAIPC